MNQLLQTVLIDPAARLDDALPEVAAQVAETYLPWSDEA